MSKSSYDFYAEIAKGYVFKVIIETLSNPLQRGYFVITQEGIKLKQADPGKTIFYNLDFPRGNFKPFKCGVEQVISVNLKHMQGLLKNVKKKDSLAIFIDEKNKPGKISIQIKPEGGKQNARIETNSIVYQKESNYKMDTAPEGGYEYPMVIEATDFQKIKRLTTSGKIINVEMQKDNYLSFTCDAGVVYDSNLKFGELEYKKPTRCQCELPENECECVCNSKNLICKSPSTKKGCGEYLCECWCICNTCEEYVEFCTCMEKQYPNYFENQYYSTMIAKLVKLPGMCSQMRFYAPNIPGYPLLIEVTAAQGNFILGTVQIFIKDVDRLAFEETQMRENGEIVPKPAGKKTKAKNKN